MNIKEVFCIDCHEWKKQKDLTRNKYFNDVLYCKECGYALVRTCDRNNK